jgi:prepilin-type N-terminal cleavage/methylation domain-containing protein
MSRGHVAHAARGCRVRERRGFTLLELLVVVLIIGILASIAMGKFTDSKRRAYTAAIKADLRNLATSAESKYASDNSYDGLAAPPGSAGVQVVVSSSANAWSATATHASVPGVTCRISSIPDMRGVRPQPDCD